LLLASEGGKAARESALATELREAGWRVLTVDLRATGATRVARDKVGSAVDHNSAEWSLWLGPTLLEQWVGDVRQVITASGAGVG
jgi:alpha-beta hydrolase superfamily lysophospholipase